MNARHKPAQIVTLANQTSVDVGGAGGGGGGGIHSSFESITVVPGRTAPANAASARLYKLHNPSFALWLPVRVNSL